MPAAVLPAAAGRKGEYVQSFFTLVRRSGESVVINVCAHGIRTVKMKRCKVYQTKRHCISQFDISNFPFDQRQIQWWPATELSPAGALLRLAPISVSSRNLCHATSLNFIIPPHDTDGYSNTRRTCRIAHWQAPPSPVRNSLSNSPCPLGRARGRGRIGPI